MATIVPNPTFWQAGGQATSSGNPGNKPQWPGAASVPTFDQLLGKMTKQLFSPQPDLPAALYQNLYRPDNYQSGNSQGAQIDMLSKQLDINNKLGLAGRNQVSSPPPMLPPAIQNSPQNSSSQMLMKMLGGAAAGGSAGYSGGMK